MSEHNPQATTKLNELSPAQRLFVLARARGVNITQAAKDAGVGRTTIYKVWDTDLIAAAILEVQQQMIRDSAVALQHILPDAIKQLEAAVDSGDLNAVKEVFNRVWGKSIERKEVSGPDGGAIPLTFIQTLDEAYGGDDE